MTRPTSSAVKEYKLGSIHSCLLFKTDERIIIDDTEFLMACGEKLKVGDCFTSIESSGSAGYPPLQLENGWYQVYIGKIKVDAGYSWVSKEDRTLLLFESYEIETGRNALDDYPASHKKKHNYICYLEMKCSGQMMFWNSCGSSRVITCREITRYYTPININRSD